MHIITPEPLSMATQFGTMKTFKQLKDLKPLSLFLSDLPHIRLRCQESEELGSSGNGLPSALVPCSCASPCTVPLIMSPWLWRRRFINMQGGERPARLPNWPTLPAPNSLSTHAKDGQWAADILNRF